MISRFLRPRTLAACIASCLTVVGLSTDNSWAAARIRTGDTDTAQAAATGALQRYIVVFSEPSLALHNRALTSGQVQAKSLQAVGMIPFARKANGRAFLDTRSPQALSYSTALSTQQAQHRAQIEKTIGRPVAVTRNFKHALNGAVMMLSAKEAAQVRRLPGVSAIVVDRTVHMSDDVSSRFIGADSVWRGGAATSRYPGYTYPTLDSLFADLNTNFGYKGDGIVVGVIDTGYNSLSPSYQATDGSGYTITNPLGAGNFAGDCNIDGISFGGCNDKVIAVYDEYSRAYGETGFSVEDATDHGSHTSSTAAGNARSGGFPGFTANFSGIAPHANLAIFSIVPPGTGSTVNSAILSAIEDAIDDGIVDVLNLSFGGSVEPDYWLDPTSQAFLAAEAANIFTAQSAGNTSASIPDQVAGTAGNDLPWVTTVAAATDPGGDAPFYFSISGPGAPPASVKNIVPTEGSFDTPLGAALPATTPVIVSPTFDAGDAGSTSAPAHGDDGCTAYPDATFANAIAVVSRGTCSFSVKAQNAVSAGAIAVIISDNRVEGPLAPIVGPPVVPVPVYSIAQSSGIAVQTYLSASAGQGTASLGYASARSAAQADVLANFSLLGPVSFPLAFDVIKPDIAAPGVGILAAVNNAIVDDNGDLVQNYGPDAVGFLSGTSMASPHIAGSAALLMGLHPDWTPTEVKSALMMTAKEYGLTKADGVTAADYYDRGAGRVQVFQASQAGLVLDETADNFFAADPNQGGNASALNLASMQNSACAVSCSFTRTLRSTQSTTLNWRTEVTGELASKVSVSPASFSLAPGGTITLTITVDSSLLVPGSGFHFADVILAPPSPLPLAPALPGLHLPVSVAVPQPKLVAATNVVNIALAGKTTSSATLALSNPGAGTILFKPATGGTQPFSWSDQANEFYNGETSTHYTDLGDGDTDFYVADDFVISGGDAVDLTSITAPGFTANHSLSSFGSGLPLHWRIYADSNGLPSSDPVTNGTAAWSYDATAGDAGVSVAGDTISLDLIAAQQSTALPAGHYWLVVYPELPCSDTSGFGCSEAWYWANSWAGSGALWASILPQTTDANTWANPSGFSAAGLGLAMTLTSTATCQVPSWLSVTPAYGSVASASTITVTFSADLSGTTGTDQATAYVCLNSSLQNSIGTVIPAATVPIQVNASK